MYCTIDDLTKAMPETVVIRLTDDEGEGDIAAAVAQECIDAAAAEIDGYIGGRVTVPLAEPYPPQIVKYSVDIAAYNLFARLREDIPTARQERYDAAIRWLMWFAAGNGYLAAAETEAAGGRIKAAGRAAEFDWGKY